MSNRRNFLTPLLSLMLFGGTSLRANTIISVRFQGADKVPVNNSAVESDAAFADANLANSNDWNHLNGDCCCLVAGAGYLRFVWRRKCAPVSLADVKTAFATARMEMI